MQAANNIATNTDAEVKRAEIVNQQETINTKNEFVLF